MMSEYMLIVSGEKISHEGEIFSTTPEPLPFNESDSWSSDGLRHIAADA
jgi:hypothetical protein